MSRHKVTPYFLAFALCSELFALRSPLGAEENLLAKGNEAFAGGDFAAAVEFYESTASRHAFLTRKYNAGVSLLRSAKLDEALERFEDAASQADGELRTRAFYNSGYCHFQKGRALATKAAEEAEGKEIDARIEELKTVAESYRSAASFFRKIDPPDAETIYNIGVVKTALVALLDEISRLMAEKKKKDEDEALKNPGELIRTLIAKEKLIRASARPWKKSEIRRGRRLALRRLRKSVSENRALTEKLLHYVKMQLEEAEKKIAATPAVPVGDDLGSLVERYLAKLDEQLQRPDLPADARTQLEQQVTQIRTLEPQLSQLPETSRKQLEEQLKTALQQLETPPSEGPTAAQLKVARDALESTLETQAASIIAYQKQDAAEAVTKHGESIRHLRKARTAFPIDIAKLVEEALVTQDGVARGVRDIAMQKTGGMVGEVKGSGFGKLLVDALKDKVLKPLAAAITPSYEFELETLAEEEEEVIWAADFMSHVPIRPEPQQGGHQQGGVQQGGHQQGGQPQAKGLSEEEARELTEKIQTQAKIAYDESSSARDLLSAHEPEAAIAPADRCLEALRRIAELLPKPEESPAELLRKLIARQESAKLASEGIIELEGETRTGAAAALTIEQRADGKVASNIREKLLANQQDPKSQEAAGKVQEGEGHVFTSAETLERDQPTEAAASIALAVDAFKEALAILQGDEKGDDKKQQDQQQQDQGDKKQDRQKQQGGYRLTPAQAQQLKEEQDKKRRREEAKLFQGSSSVAVEKDW